jgi:hypothetical protein
MAYGECLNLRMANQKRVQNAGERGDLAQLLRKKPLKFFRSAREDFDDTKCFQMQ